MSEPKKTGQSNPTTRANIRLLVCDIDGTLIDEKGELSEDNRQAIARLQEAGIGFTLATGRIDRTAQPIAEALSVSLPVITGNGAVIKDLARDELLSLTPMDHGDTARVAAWLWEKRYDFICYSTDEVFYPPYGQRIRYIRQLNAWLADRGQQAITLIELTSPDLPQPRHGWVKIHAALPDLQALERTREMLAEQTAFAGVRPGTTLLDIMAQTVSKGRGVEALARFLNLDLAAIATIGDHDNDVSMLQLSGLAIAMGNASQAARAASHHITASNGASGVARAIEQFIL